MVGILSGWGFVEWDFVRVGFCLSTQNHMLCYVLFFFVYYACTLTTLINVSLLSVQGSIVSTKRTDVLTTSKKERFTGMTVFHCGLEMIKFKTNLVSENYCSGIYYTHDCVIIVCITQMFTPMFTFYL